MLFSDMNEEQKRQFFEEQEARVDKLRTIRPKVNMNNVVSQEEVIRIKEAKKRKARELYWNYHKKPSNHPDNWKKI
jgi:hypothetical protein